MGGSTMNHDKEEAKRLIESLPENASWDDIMYELYVQQKLSESLKAANAGRTIPHEEVKKRFSCQ
jgi:predicted transcriptional regulator